MKQNITLSLDRDIIQRARVLAAQRGSSVSRMLGRELAKMVTDAESYERAKRRALDLLRVGYRLGGKGIADSEELHAR